MTIEEAIYAKLTTDGTVSALMGTRLYPAQAPQSATFPLAVYDEASARQAYTLAGVLNLNLYSMRIDCFDDSYAGAKALRNAIRDCLGGYRGDLESGTVSVRGIFNESADDGIETPIHADEFGIFRAGLDLSIHYGIN